MDATSQPPLSLATSQSSRSGGSVAILADDAGALERIRAALRDQAGVMSLEDLLGTRDGPPQVVILARPLSSRRTIVELQRLSSVLPSSSIVVISALSDRRAMRRALIAGASGFVHLDDIKTALAPAVRSAAAGYVSRCLGRMSGLSIGPSSRTGSARCCASSFSGEPTARSPGTCASPRAL